MSGLSTPFVLHAFWQAFVLGFVSLFAVINPVGRALLFQGLTSGVIGPGRWILAGKVAICSVIVLLCTALFGNAILSSLGISISAVRVGGGLAVAANAWKYLTTGNHSRSELGQTASLDAERTNESFFFPLTVPFTAGPGAIVVALMLPSHQAGGGRSSPFAFGIGAAIVALGPLIWLCYASSSAIDRLVGSHAAKALSQMVAFLLLCVGIQFVCAGIREILIHA